MPLIYSHESHTFRVDGDVLETFLWGGSEQRVLLAWLAVQVFPAGRNTLALQIGAAPPDIPLYQVLPKASPIPGRGAPALQMSVTPEEEPALREFFTQVARLCGRSVLP
jgi:hypothetical protein